MMSSGSGTSTAAAMSFDVAATMMSGLASSRVREDPASCATLVRFMMRQMGEKEREGRRSTQNG
jgi:hypothetical protein